MLREDRRVVETSFHAWLHSAICRMQQAASGSRPVFWFDPRVEWRDALKVIADELSIELWADPTEHELVLRERLINEPKAFRIIWLPKTRDQLTWLKVFEVDAAAFWERGVIESLREYGVQMDRDHEKDFAALLPTHLIEWFDKPQDVWKELTPSSARATLVDETRILQILAGADREFPILEEQGLFAIFAKRVVDELGLPDPTNKTEDQWRILATATLLCTEAALLHSQEPPTEVAQTIPPGSQRTRAIKLLRAWQENITLMPTFEYLVPKADATTGLSYWARNLTDAPKPVASRIVEDTLFRKIAEELDKIDEIDVLASELEKRLSIFLDHASGFWCKHATDPIRWDLFLQFGQIASLLIENSQADKTWNSCNDAVAWYTERGWQLDKAAEMLFEESPNLPSVLHRIRARLRRAYLRRTDHTATAFSDLLAHNNRFLSELPSAGEVVLAQLKRERPATALIFLDACRLELAFRLTELLNNGEPVRRATVLNAVAPVPSITAIGMAFALPIEREKLHIELSGDQKSFKITSHNFKGDLTAAEQRRKWLTEHFGVKQFLSIAEVLDSEKLVRKSKNSLLVVNGAEFDDAGHEGQLLLTGADEHITRYLQAIRKLRDFGFNRIIVTTDHGFFHWQPEPDEVESVKPSGSILWSSRRAIVGNSLEHASALKIAVPCSGLDVMVPRSINAFKTYGGLGFFHGGATLQEIIIPVMIVDWPAKAAKIDVVLKPVQYITNENPRVQIEAASTSVGQLMFADANQLARRVLIRIEDPSSGKVVFKHEDAITISPNGPRGTVQLKLVETPPKVAFGSRLLVVVRDADEEDILIREEVTLKVEIDEW